MVIYESHYKEQILTVEQLKLLPSDKDIRFYQKHGWYISKTILSEKDMDSLQQGITRFYSGERDERLPVELHSSQDWTPLSRQDGIRINEFLVQQNREAFQLSKNPILGAIAALLTGSDQIRLFSSSLYYKPPRPEIDAEKSVDTTIGWHHDRGYWKTCTSENMISVWIPLHDCDEHMGTITMIDGSHRWHNASTSKRWFSHFIDSDPRKQEETLVNAAEGRSIRKVPMNLKRGQVSFHHCLTFHGSPPNLSHHPRIALSFHMQDRENHYRRYLQENGETHVHNNDSLCRRLPDGMPDYADPKICPVLWEGPLHS